MNGFWIGDRIHYSDRDWEITDVAGNLLGLIDVESGERLTASVLRVIEECPMEDRLGRGTAALTLAETLEAQVKAGGQRDGVLAAVDRVTRDVQEVAFGRAEGAAEFKPGYGQGSSRWSRAGLKASELRAVADQLETREPGLARKLSLSQDTLFRKARAYEMNGPAALIDKRMTRTHRVTELVPAEVLEVCEQVNRESVSRSNISKSQRLAMVRSRIAKQYPDHEFKVPGNGRLRKVLDELANGMYLTGDASNRRSAAAVPERVLKSRPALLPGSEMQVDSTKLDILVIFPDGKVRRPDFAWIIDKATRCVGGTALAVKICGADLAFMIAQCMTPRPRSDLPDEPKNRWEMHQRDLPWPQFFDPDAREKVDVRAPLIRPRRIVTDNARDYTSRVVDAACQQFGITLVRSAVRTPTDKGLVENRFATLNSRLLAKLPGYVGRSVAARGRHPEKDDLLTLSEFAWLLDRWIVHFWQNTPTEGLRDPRVPAGPPLSPNAAYMALFPYVGFVPAPLSRNDRISLLPALTRTVQRDGIEIEYRMYDSPELGGLRRRSGVSDGKWEVHYMPANPSTVWVYDDERDTYIDCAWKEDRLDKPFSVAVRTLARKVVDDGGVDPAFCREDTNMEFINEYLNEQRRIRKQEATNELERTVQQAQQGLRPGLATIDALADNITEPDSGDAPYDDNDTADDGDDEQDTDDEGDDLLGFETVNGTKRWNTPSDSEPTEI